MRLHTEWRHAWKWFSMHAMGFSLALVSAWVAIPESMQAVMPPVALKGLLMLALSFGIIGRLVPQKSES